MAVAVLDIVKLEDKLKDIVDVKDKENFLFDFLDLYDIPKSSITKLKTGTINLSDNPGDYHLKNKLFFRETEENPITDYAILIKEIEYMSSKPRYVFVTDFETVLAQDTKTKESLDINFEDLPQYFDFFLAWNGVEKADLEKENPLDVKAAERFARLYELLNEINKDEDKHHLNLFLTRVIFCLFAEDTGIFEKKSFTNGLKQFTKEDGSNINGYLSELFKSLDNENKEDVPTIYKHFPYVNGKLFRESHQTIKFDSQAWNLLIECGEMLNWSEINPDIFGSMIQTIASKDTRENLGMHYTSVSNILKVIKPLFLDDLYEEFEVNFNKKNKLQELYNRLGKIKFFDPACGSGNFLIITYKELRKFEMVVFNRINELSSGDMVYLPSVTLDQFYGIELEEFASEVAQVSLWIADHQMNMDLEKEHMDLRPTLPLNDAGKIKNGNALLVDWDEICPHEDDEEVYVFGNPPYSGNPNKKQKKDMDYVFKGLKNYKSLDFIGSWFYLGKKYIKNTRTKLAFVTTNSVVQGRQVEYLWSKILFDNIDIDFAYLPFKWANNARSIAGVTVVIIGLIDGNHKSENIIFDNNNYAKVESISPYLTSGPKKIVKGMSKPLFTNKNLIVGSRPNDSGYLIFTKDDYESSILKYPELKECFKKFMSGKDFTNNTHRYCLWMTDELWEKHRNNPIIKQRISLLYQKRKKDNAADGLIKKPYKFQNNRNENQSGFFIPQASSANREYIPMGLIDKETIVADPNFTLYNPKFEEMALLMSKMHMVWIDRVAGKLRQDYRYSVRLCYNTFPFIEIPNSDKETLRDLVLNIFDIRAEEGKKLADLYSRDTMPKKLRRAHEDLDLAVEQLYQKKPFSNDTERLDILFEMYNEKID